MKYFILSIFLVSIFSLNIPIVSADNLTELSRCNSSSNCVLEKWDVSEIKNALTLLKEIIENTPRTNIVEEENNYIHAEVTSKWLKFVDDLEILYSNNENLINVKSKSRVGESDFGVNQKRVDLLRYRLFELSS